MACLGAGAILVGLILLLVGRRGYFDFRKTVATEQPLVGQGITVVLFNDLEEARQSTMYYEVWGGQVRIGPVIIAGERPQSSDWEEPQTPPPPIINAVGVNP